MLQVWRVSFALGAVPLAFMIYYRIFHLRESAVWVKRTGNKSRSAETGLLFKWYVFSTTSSPALSRFGRCQALESKEGLPVNMSISLP